MSGTDHEYRNNNSITSSNYASAKVQDQEELLIKKKGGGFGFAGVAVLRNITNELDEYCHTPTEDENKIPVLLAPPPAPRKPALKRKLNACKRKLFSETQQQVSHHHHHHRIVVKREEIDAFFKTSYEELAAAAAGNTAMAVKRCKCT